MLELFQKLPLLRVTDEMPVGQLENILLTTKLVEKKKGSGFQHTGVITSFPGRLLDATMASSKKPIIESQTA